MAPFIVGKDIIVLNYKFGFSDFEFLPIFSFLYLLQQKQIQ